MNDDSISTHEFLSLDKQWDRLLLRFYGTVGYLRDLEAMPQDERKAPADSYRLQLDNAETQALLARRDVVNFAHVHDAQTTDAFRVLRFSRDPLISGFAAEVDRRRSTAAQGSGGR